MRALALVLALASWVAPSRGRAQITDGLAEGRAARDAGDHEAALAAFTAEWSASAAPIARAEMAREELALGRWALAETHATEALAFAGDAAIDALAADLAAAQGTAAEHLGSLEVRCHPGCAITVDGTAVGTSPLTHLIRLEAGPHAVRATLEGYRSAETRVEVTARAVARVELAPEWIDQRPILERTGGTGDGQRIAAYTAFAVGGVALVIGSVALGVELDRDAVLRSDACAPTAMVSTREAACPEAASTRGTYTDVARAMLLSAGVLGLAGLVLVLTAPSDPTRASASCAPVGAGIVCRATF